jgi:signal transduction histidine kinase
VIAILILTGSIIYEQLADAGATFSLTNPTIWVFLFTALGAIILGVWITAIIGQSARRRQLIERLEATQAELAATERRAGILEERQRLARDIHIHIYGKLGVDDRTAAVTTALEKGIITLAR